MNSMLTMLDFKCPSEIKENIKQIIGDTFLQPRKQTGGLDQKLQFQASERGEGNQKEQLRRGLSLDVCLLLWGRSGGTETKEKKKKPPKGRPRSPRLTCVSS